MSKVNEELCSEEYDNKNIEEFPKKMECIALAIGKCAKEIYDILKEDEHFEELMKNNDIKIM